MKILKNTSFFVAVFTFYYILSIHSGPITVPLMCSKMYYVPQENPIDFNRPSGKARY